MEQIYKPKNNFMNIKEIAKIIKKLSDNGETNVTMKVTAIMDLIKHIENSEIYIQLLLAQKTVLIEKLMELGLNENQIKELLKLQ